MISRIIAVLAFLLAVLSIGLNLLLIMRLDQGRAAAVEVLDHTSQRLGAMSTMSISQTVRINRTISVSGEMPLNQNFTFPISMVVPVSTAMNVNVNTPIGPMNMPINVNTNFPFKMQVPIAFNRTIPYSLTVPVDLAIPVEIKLRDLGIDSTIKDTQDEIQRLKGALQ